MIPVIAHWPKGYLLNQPCHTHELSALLNTIVLGESALFNKSVCVIRKAIPFTSMNEHSILDAKTTETLPPPAIHWFCLAINASTLPSSCHSIRLTNEGYSTVRNVFNYNLSVEYWSVGSDCMKVNSIVVNTLLAVKNVGRQTFSLYIRRRVMEIIRRSAFE
jgi:hypothetical protein